MHDKPMFEFIEKAMNEKERIKIMENFDYLLQNVISFNHEQVETVVINKNISDVWDVITDFNIFKNYTHGIGDQIVYDGDRFQVDTKIHIYFKDRSKEYHMKVIKCGIQEEAREYVVSFFAGVPKSPKQDLKFILVKYSDDRTLLMFKHIFKNYVSYNLIDRIALDKKDMLRKMKENFEKENCHMNINVDIGESKIQDFNVENNEKNNMETFEILKKY